MAETKTKNKNNAESDEIIESEDVLLLDDDDTEDEVVEKEVAEEEKKFSAGTIPASQLDATRLYLNEIGFSPLLTAEEEVYYSRKLLKGDEAARKKMIECNLRLVVKISRRSEEHTSELQSPM